VARRPIGEALLIDVNVLPQVAPLCDEKTR